MSCLKDDVLLLRYVDDEVPEPIRHRVEVALDTCAHCRDVVAANRALGGLLRESTRDALAPLAPLDLWAGIEARLERAPPEPAWTVRWREALRRLWSERPLELGFGAAAAVALAALVVWVGRSVDAPQPEPGDQTLAGVTMGQDNGLVVESYEVAEGTVVIDQNPDDVAAPTIVWHFVEGDATDGATGT